MLERIGDNGFFFYQPLQWEIQRRGFFMAKKCKQNRNVTVWVVPYTQLETEPMKEDSFGYNDWDIYHG